MISETMMSTQSSSFLLVMLLQKNLLLRILDVASVDD